MNKNTDNTGINTNVFGELVIYRDYTFDFAKLPEGDENLIPPREFAGMLVNANSEGEGLTLTEVISVYKKKFGIEI